jgi:hypothetical protein
MELLLAMILASIVIGGKSKPKPALCRHCDLMVHVDGDNWTHENGQRYMPYPGLRTQIMHPAVPSSYLS